MSSRSAKFENFYFKFYANFFIFNKLVKIQIVKYFSFLTTSLKLTISVNFFTLNCQFIDESSFDAITPNPLEESRIQCDLNLPPPHKLFLDLEP